MSTDCYELCNYTEGVCTMNKEHKYYLTNNNGNIFPWPSQHLQNLPEPTALTQKLVSVTVLNEIITEMSKFKRMNYSLF